MEDFLNSIMTNEDQTLPEENRQENTDKFNHQLIAKNSNDVEDEDENEWTVDFDDNNSLDLTTGS